MDVFRCLGIPLISFGLGQVEIIEVPFDDLVELGCGFVQT